MEKAYQKYKGVKVVHKDYEGIVAGYTDDHLILACETSNRCSFRRLMKDTFIQEEFKDVKYRYIYENESTVIKQRNDL